LPAATQGVAVIKVYIAFGSASIGKDLFLALIERTGAFDLVGHSRDADRAIAEIRKEKPQLIIAEETLTFGQGMDVVKSIKQQKGFPAASIIVSTKPAPISQEELLSRGIDLWLQLPQDASKLGNALNVLNTDYSGDAFSKWVQQLAKLKP
jgi:DNA-binding NarL/FixJ family response regulator